MHQDLAYIVDLPEKILVSQLIDLINQKFSKDVFSKYLYEANEKRVLDSNKTLTDNNVKSGSYLFLI